jgi:hypothetical protein
MESLLRSEWGAGGESESELSLRAYGFALVERDSLLSGFSSLILRGGIKTRGEAKKRACEAPCFERSVSSAVLLAVRSWIRNSVDTFYSIGVWTSPATREPGSRRDSPLTLDRMKPRHVFSL